MEQLEGFIPNAPNFGPFVTLQGPVAAFIAIILGIVGIIGIINVGVGALKWAFAGDNGNKRAMASAQMKHGIITVIVVIALPLIVRLFSTLVNAVF